MFTGQEVAVAVARVIVDRVHEVHLDLVADPEIVQDQDHLGREAVQEVPKETPDQDLAVIQKDPKKMVPNTTKLNRCLELFISVLCNVFPFVCAIVAIKTNFLLL